MTDRQAKPVALEAARRMHNRYWYDRYWSDYLRREEDRLCDQQSIVNKAIRWMVWQEQPWWKRAWLRLKGVGPKL